MTQRIPLHMENQELHKPASESIPVALPPDDASLEEKVVAVLRTCYDPEIPVNIYELGLIYDVQMDENNVVEVRMTLTSRPVLSPARCRRRSRPRSRASLA
jgi:hypothetical protein